MAGRTVNKLASAFSRKRNREDDEDGLEEEIVDVRHATSRLQNDTRKRARVSDSRPSKRRHRAAAPSDEEEESSTEEEPQERRRQRSPDSPPKTQYELMRDHGFEHLQHEAADDHRATQRLVSRVGRQDQYGDNHAAENGILETLECFNFMCHEHLKVSLGPLLNFIVGENGSGKSAILTGIVICLGVKASSTNRGGSLKSFVKSGAEKSILMVTIKNQGDSAYKRDIYGDSIIVERHFGTTGTSSFKVKSAAGRIISTKKSEVDEIVEYYALQVDNPLNVLSQDNARQFLNASTRSQKYKFFIDGIQLQQLDTDYRLIQELIERIEARIPELEESTKSSRAKYDDAKQIRATMKGTRAIKAKQRTLTNQAVWIQIRDQERKLEQMNKELANFDNDMEAAQGRIEATTEALQAADQRVAETQEMLKEEQAKLDERKAAVDASKAKHDELKEELQKMQFLERDSWTELNGKAKIVRTLEEQVQAETKRLEDSTGDAALRKNEELTQAKEAREAHQKELQDCQARKSELERSRQEAMTAAQKTTEVVKAKQDEIANVEKVLRETQDKAPGKYDGFERNMADLLRAIEKDNRFERKPIGPVGAYIQLRKPRWSQILDHTLNKTLSSFVVNSKRDADLLREHMRRQNIRSGAPIVKNFDRVPLNLDGKEPDAKFDTIYRVLKIENPIIRDALIINHAIEQMLLIWDKKEAENVMLVGSPPRNVKACLAGSANRGQGWNLATGGGSHKVSAFKMPPRRSRIQTNAGDQVTIHKETLRQLQDELGSLDQERRRLVQDQQRRKTAVDQQSKEEVRLKKAVTNADVVIDRIMVELDAFDGVDNRLRGLQEQLEEAKKDKDHYGDQYGDIKLQKADKNREAAAAKQELKVLNDAVAAQEHETQRVHQILTKRQQEREAAVHDKNQAVGLIDVMEQEKEGNMAKRDEQQTLVQDYVEKARNAGYERRPELLETDTYESIKKQLTAIENQYDKVMSKYKMSEAEAHELYEQRKAQYQSLSSVLSENRSFIRRMSVTLDLRLNRWRKFQRLISAAARAQFEYLLSFRKFRGKLRIDHKHRTLDLFVEPDKAEKKIGGRTTKTLSGGEKSFSSICLLLSIWEAMGSPLRCLDEFDVFMDNVNRAISTELLIQAARQSVNRQYIFITPNPIHTIDKDVKIHRMTDPRQRTLPMAN